MRKLKVNDKLVAIRDVYMGFGDVKKCLKKNIIYKIKVVMGGDILIDSEYMKGHPWGIASLDTYFRLKKCELSNKIRVL